MAAKLAAGALPADKAAVAPQLIFNQRLDGWLTVLFTVDSVVRDSRHEPGLSASVAWAAGARKLRGPVSADEARADSSGGRTARCRPGGALMSEGTSGSPRPLRCAGLRPGGATCGPCREMTRMSVISRTTRRLIAGEPPMSRKDYFTEMQRRKWIGSDALLLNAAPHCTRMFRISRRSIYIRASRTSRSCACCS